MRCIWLIALSIFSATGCAGMAKKEVRALVDQEHDRVVTAKSRLTDPMIDNYLFEIASPILAAARQLDGVDAPAYKHDPVLEIHDKFEIIVVHDPSPNAWVVGDDFACITTAALLLADHPDEIAFVLAHEYGHMRGSHHVKSVIRRYETQVAAGIAMGLAAGMTSFGAAQNPYYSQAQRQQDASNISQLGNAIVASYRPYRKADEHDADKQAVEIMAAAGFPLERCADFMARMLPLYGEGGGDTHPPTSERIVRIRNSMTAHAGYTPRRFLDVFQFQQIQTRVKQLTLSAVDNQSLSFYSVERAQMAGHAMFPPLQACGPLDAATDRVFNEYQDQVLGRR